MSTDELIIFKDVSKFYGEVLGVNGVNLRIPRGLTGLVGPNGSGKSTLMHLISGLLRPSRGRISVRGIAPHRPQELFRVVGYCTQYDSFPAGLTGLRFLAHSLALHGYTADEAARRSWEVLELVGLSEAARRPIAGYSKGMRQRIKLGHALAHQPQVLILDEPLNGLDPMGRAEIIDLFKELAAEGRHVIVSSHILHEVDLIADHVVMIHGGAVVAEGEIRAVRGEITSHPIQVLIRCDRPREVAARLLAMPHVVEIKVVDDTGGGGMLVRTRDATDFFAKLGAVVLATGVDVETIMPADESVRAVYDYLIGDEGASA